MTIKERTRRCIEKCRQCTTHCANTLRYCLQKKEYREHEKLITTLQDCVDACGLTELFLIRNSDYKNKVCQLSAEVCDDTSEICETIDASDPVFNRCIFTCHECADSCRDITSMHTLTLV